MNPLGLGFRLTADDLAANGIDPNDGNAYTPYGFAFDVTNVVVAEAATVPSHQ